MKKLFGQCLAITLLFVSGSFVGLADDKIRKYEFDIEYKTVNFTGKPVKAMAIGGSIPAPLIEAKVGETLQVTFHNKMDVESSVHWHGILLPPDQDGVAYLNTRPIGAGESFTFSFKIKHTGTYWYHSHTALQEQRGLYGPIRLLPADPVVMSHDDTHHHKHHHTKHHEHHAQHDEHHRIKHDTIVLWSDWTDEKPMDVLRNLKRDGHYYDIKKDSSQNWLRVIKHGPQAIKNRLKSAWTRMGPMDISDIGYDIHLANGAPTTQLMKIKPGEKIRVRMINAAASSYFNVEFAGGPMTIVALDGIDIQPVTVQRLQHAIAETYDIVVTVPQDGNYELRATNSDGTGYTSAFIGNPQASKVYAPDIARPNLFLTDHSAHTGKHDTDHSAHTSKNDRDHSAHTGKHDTDHSSHAHHSHRDDAACSPEHAAMGHCTTKSEMSHAMSEVSTAKSRDVIKHLTDYSPFKAKTKTTLDDNKPLRKIHLTLTGNMERYIWSFNGKTLSEADRIKIKKGERVQFIFENKTMMSHPLHLHGHFFRLLNGQGEYSPLKHTFDLPGMGTATIEFDANEEKDWIFHCHNLYHMKTGMSRVISYAGTSTIDDQFARNLSMDDHWFKFADVAALSNQHFGSLWMVNNRYKASLTWEGDYRGEAEVDLRGDIFIDRYSEAFAGVEAERHHGQVTAVGYVGYALMLPMMIHSEIRLDTKGKVRLTLGGDMHLTSRLKFDWHWNTDDGAELKLDYEINKKLSIIAQHHHDYDFGVGVMVKF